MYLEINTPFDIGESVDIKSSDKVGVIINIKLDDKYKSRLEYLIEFDDGERSWHDGILLHKI